jgi:hypothetical protein
MPAWLPSAYFSGSVPWNCPPAVELFDGLMTVAAASVTKSRHARRCGARGTREKSMRLRLRLRLRRSSRGQHQQRVQCGSSRGAPLCTIDFSTIQGGVGFDAPGRGNARKKSWRMETQQPLDSRNMSSSRRMGWTGERQLY